MKKLFLFVGISLIFLLGCASGLRGLTPQQKDQLKPLVKANISEEELDTLVMLIKTDAPQWEIQKRITGFWNKKYQSLSPEEQVTYHSLRDSVDKTKYLSCKTRWERKLLLRKIVKKQKQKLWETEDNRIFYFSFKLVATDKELKEYLNLPDSLREDWLYTFWKKKDPDPTTQENEFKTEFDRRVEYVLYNFWVPFGQLRPWDDRGDVYILYGEPNEILGPELSYEQLGAESGQPDPGLGKGGGESEVWHYHKYGSFQFGEDTPGVSKHVPYVRFGQSKKDATATFLKTITEKVEVAKAEFIPDFGSPLNYPWNWWKFWNDGDFYNIRINLGIPIEKLGLISDSVSIDTGWLCFQERIIITDERRKPVASDSLWIKKKISKYLDRKDLLFVDQYSYDSLAPGFYTIAVSVKDSASDRVGIYQDTSVILVSHVKLKAGEKISQLIMADSVWMADSSYIQKNGYKFIRNGLVIRPRPGNVYLSGQAPSFYCEMYGLKKGENDSARCRINFYILKKGKGGKFTHFSKPSAEEATWPMDSQPYIKGTLNPDKLPQGEYIIRIDVYDLNDKKAKESQIRKTIAGFKIS